MIGFTDKDHVACFTMCFLVQLPNRRRDHGTIYVQRGQNGGQGELPGAQVPIHGERVLSVQRQAVRQAWWRMQQYGIAVITTYIHTTYIHIHIFV